MIYHSRRTGIILQSEETNMANKMALFGLNVEEPTNRWRWPGSGVV